MATFWLLRGYLKTHAEHEDAITISTSVTGENKPVLQAAPRAPGGKNMESVKEIFIALAILFGSGYAAEKVHFYVKQMAIKQIQKGLPPLSNYTQKLTRK